MPTIESQLSELWKQKTEVSSESDQQAVMRACVLNLMVYAPGEESGRGVTEIMTELTKEHPARAILILAKPDAAGNALDASVAVHCHRSAGARKQVCCEQIILKAEGESISQVPSLVRPLIIPDLPVFLWWRDVLDFENLLLAGLVETSDRVIVDSTGLADIEGGFPRLVSLMDERARWTAFSDLNWARLTPWRVLVAGFFDVPDYRTHLRRIGRVEIDCEVKDANEQSIPNQALLLASWLASRLRWQPTLEPRWINLNTYQWELKSEDRTTTIQFKISTAKDDARIGLSSLQLVVDDTPARFVTSIGPVTTHLESRVTLGAKSRVGKMIRLHEDNEAQLVGKELEILRHDKVYEQSLKFLATSLTRN